MRLFSLIISILSFSFCFGQNHTIASFQAEADSAGLIFTMPQGYSVSEVKENPDLFYSFAIVNADKSMEVRYSIWPLQDMFIEYERSLTDSTFTMVNPNSMYLGRVQANMMNMTGGQIYNVGAFPEAAVKKEFNADKGGSCFFEFNCEFGKGWHNGQFIYLHKDGVADVIITFMSNDIDRHSKLMGVAFHSLKFKE